MTHRLFQKYAKKVTGGKDPAFVRNGTQFWHRIKQKSYEPDLEELHSSPIAQKYNK